MNKQGGLLGLPLFIETSVIVHVTLDTAPYTDVHILHR